MAYNALTTPRNDTRGPLLDTPRYWRACWQGSRDARRRWLAASTDPARHNAAAQCRRNMREEARGYARARAWQVAA